MRHGAVIIAALLVLPSCGGGGGSPSAPGTPTPTPAPRPNIVLILADDLDLDNLAYMPRTKALLADRGTTFANAFVTTPLCSPSRASILTGQYAHNHGLLTNQLPLGGFEKWAASGKESATIATALKGSGDTQPFFLYLAVGAPHTPAFRHPKYAGQFQDLTAPRTASFNEGDVSDKPAYLREFPLFTDREERRIDFLYRDRVATLQSVDELLDKVMAELDALGELANTLVVLTSDNGFLLGTAPFQPGQGRALRGSHPGAPDRAGAFGRGGGGAARDGGEPRPGPDHGRPRGGHPGGRARRSLAGAPALGRGRLRLAPRSAPRVLAQQ